MQKLFINAGKLANRWGQFIFGATDPTKFKRKSDKPLRFKFEVSVIPNRPCKNR